jgi:SAM-dependent methyltransferase
MYDSAYYDGFRRGSLQSARVIVRLLREWVAPKSVIDLGCGTGDWLSVFKEAGVEDVLGVDGAHVERGQLAIPEHDFCPYDLTTPYSGGRRYDLAMSVEVAEHLPDESGRTLIRSLIDLAPIVLFSAAIPLQRGEGHVNCQWPAYWAVLFAERGYVAIDAIRFRLWGDARVDWWYRQNIVLYASENQIDRWPMLKAMRDPRCSWPLPLVHPEMFQQVHQNLLEWGVDWERRYWQLWEERSHAVGRDGVEME